MPTNERLTALLIEAGFLDREGKIGRKRFARAVTESPTAQRVGRAYNHTYVGRWLTGMTPRDAETPTAICEALGRRLGRVVSLDELGFRLVDTYSLDIGLTYPDRPEDGVSSIADLLDADLTHGGALARTTTNVGAWNEATTAWLVESQKPLAEIPAPSKVSKTDIVKLRAVRQMFDRLDSTFGGAHARQALVQHLRTSLPQLLRASGPTSIRHELFAAASELTQLAAWMSYDAGLHGVAQRYFIQALGLADAANDRLLAASILDAMSHQATFLGRYREAANMARAARLGTQLVAAPILTAHFYTMEARALARIGDKEACLRAMGSAAELFGRHSIGDGPEWIQYFNATELYAELGHCYRDLGKPDHAIAHATRALASVTGDYMRSDFFVAMVLADAHIDRGDVDEGCRVAEQAILVGESLDSERCVAYVSEFRARLANHSAANEVESLSENLRSSKLWLP